MTKLNFALADASSSGAVLEKKNIYIFFLGGGGGGYLWDITIYFSYVHFSNELIEF